MSKERPILFSGPMVRAILSGQKSVTRRAIKHQPDVPVTDAIPRRNYPHGPATVDWYWRPRHGHLNGVPSHGWDFKCPYGQPGDRLWVRESTEADDDTSDVVTLARYCADKAPVMYWDEDDGEPVHAVSHWNYPRRVRPSIHMKREQARILLEITAVRVERLQAITPDQAIAEGVDAAVCRQFLETSPTRHQLKECELQGFSGLWESINGEGSWDANPWVWVVEFKRVSP